MIYEIYIILTFELFKFRQTFTRRWKFTRNMYDVGAKEYSQMHRLTINCIKHHTNIFTNMKSNFEKNAGRIIDAPF